MAGGEMDCITEIKLNIARLGTEFTAFKEASKEARLHIEQETERRLEILNNKTAWVDKQQTEMRAAFTPVNEYRVERDAICRRIISLETERDKMLGRNSVISIATSAATALLLLLLNFILTGPK
ncbi:MAG: hypothetical protein WC551_09325 [Patescibacteria group bacterium]